MAKDNKRPLYTLYESLKNDDYDVPDNYESFERTLTAKGDEGTKNRMTLYNSLKSNNYDVPDTYESFANTLFIGPTPKSAAEPKPTQYFKLRRGGKDFTVSTDEVNAAGGLSEWAKTHPGAPVRVYMKGKKDDGTDFYGHVDLASAQERRKSGYKYTTTHKITPPAQPQKPWKPTTQEKVAMSHQLDQMQSDADQIIKGSRERTENMAEYYRNSNGLDSKAIESKPVVDLKTGKLNKTYVTPTGERTTNKAVADMATYNHRQAMAAADMSVGAQIRRAQAELEELHRQANERGKAVAEASNDENSGFFSKVVAGMQMAHGTPLSAGTGRALNEDQEFKMLSTAIRQKEEQLKNLIEERDRQAGKDVGFWRGFGRVAGDQRTWDFGVGDLSDAMNLKNSDKAATDGEKKAAQEMLKSVYDKEQTEQMYGDNASFWNRAGIMTGYMPSFMLDFAMTGGGFDILNMASKAATKGSAKFIGKEALKEMGELGVKEYAKKYGVRGIGRMAENWTIKALGTTADDLLIRAPLMTNTVQAGKTAADIVDRKLGNVVIDENGNYDFSNDKSWGSAVWQGEANAIIENYSEMFGTHLDGFIPTLAKTFGGKRISGMLARANASSFGQILSTTRKQFESLGVSDYLGEVSEEYYGQLWRTMLNLDDAYQQNPDGTRTNLLFTGQFHGDIWGGMALSMGLMGAGKYSISGIAYGNMKHQVNKADKKAAEIFTPNRWEPLRELIDNTTNEDIGVLAENMVNDQNLSDDERSAVMGYMESSLNLRGLNLGAMAKSRGTAEGDEALHENIEVDSELSQSYIDGYEASSPQEMNDAQNMYEFHRQRVEGMFEPDMLDWFDRDSVTALIDMSRNGIFSQEEIDAARDYINAKTVRDGMIQRVNDDIDEQIAQSDAMIGGRVNQATGMIQPALMGLDDREVYVVGGFLAINEDGTIDRDASDESIVIRDAVTGDLEFTDPKSIVSAMAEIDPDAYKAEAAETIRQQAAQTAADAINGTLSFNPGDVIIMDNNGSQATVLGPAIDQETGVPVEGQVIVQLPDGSQSVLSKEELQEMSDAANLERLNSFEQERAAQRAQQEAQKAEAMRPQFKLNDEFTILGENGTPIRGSITREVDEDGLVEIYTEEPLNDKNVNRISPAELEGMFDTYNGEPMATTVDVPENAEIGPNSTENPEINSEISENLTETVPNSTEAATETQQSALSRIPTDEEGEPLFEQTDAATAWDGLTEYFGDADDAIEFARSRVQSLKKEAEKLNKAVNDVRATGSPKEFKEAKAKARAELVAKKAQLDHWNSVVNAKIAKEQAEAEAKRQAEEADREEKRQAYLAAEAERRQQEEAHKAEIEAAKAAEESARVEADKKAAIEAALPASREKANAAQNFESYFDALKEEAIKEGGVSARDRMADKITNAKGGKQYSEVYEVLSQESAPATLEEYLARMLSLGGTRVQWSGAHNLGGEVFGREKVGERPEYRWMTSDANGVSFPQFIHSLWESLTKDGNIGFNVDEVSDQDVRNAVVDLLREHPTSRSLFEHAIDLHDNRMQSELLNGKVAELEHYADEIKDEWYKENYGLTATEYESYVENVYKEIEEQGLTDEDILALDEMIADEYAAMQNQTNIENNGTESRQSTDDTENQSGDAILPSTPTDRREGASGDVEAQPEETGRDSNSEDGAAQTEAEIDPDLSPEKDPEQTIDAGVGAVIAAAEAEVNTDPTEAQKEAGNYKKGHVKLGKFDVTIEQPAGSVRRGTDANGKKWETTMQNTYGYIRGTEGVDGDHIDVFLSNNFDAWDGQRVVIVDQYNPDGSFDEHKVMLGFNDKADAINAYLANYKNGWENGRKLVYSSATLEDFEKWIESSHRKTKPYHEYKIADKAEIEGNSPALANEKNPSGNRLVSDERYAELRERMRKKFGSQLNMGVDPEIIAIGTEMAVYHIEKGARKFKAYASAMITDLGDAIRPYLKAFYNAVRDMPEVEAAGFVADMDSYDEVRSIDIANLDKPGTDAMATAAAVVAEQKIENIAKEAERLNSKIDEYTQHLADFLSIAEEDLTEDVEEFILREREALNQELVDYFLRQGVPIDAAEKQSKELLDNIQSQTSVVIARKLQADPEKISGNDTVEKNTKKPSNKKKTGKTKPKSTIDSGLFDIAETPTITTPEPRPIADLMGDSSAYQDRGAQTAELVEEIGGVIESRVMMLQLDPESVKPLTMAEVKKMASKYSALNDISDTDLQELVELAMTQLTRSEAIINVDGTAEQQRAAFDHIVNLYQIQPSLNARDSERLIKQQYSTPTPFGYVMGQFVRAGGKTVGSMLEPSAGNGALTITVHPSLVHVNDIDEARLANLRKLGYAQVTAQDALLPFGGDKVDVVMTNPPFGTVTEKVYDAIFHVSSLEAQMAINALEKMKDDGRAAIVIGGNTSYRTNGSMNPKDAAFFGYLYSHYNVADVINISGKALYSRNGTGYDVRMILIDGRKTGEFQRVYPPIKAKARAEQVTTFDELYKRVQDDIQQIQQVGSQSADVQREPETATDGTASAQIRSGSNRPNSGAGQRPGTTSDAVRDTPRTDSGQPATVDDGSRPVGVDNAVSGDAGSSDNVPQPKSQQPRSVGSGSTQNGTGRSGSDGRPAATSRPDSSTERLAVKPDLTAEKVPYPNQSDNGFTLMSVVPAAQAQVLQKSLGEIGDVDQYLVDELGYSSKEELYGYLAAEQIDSIALAIHQMNKGNAFIIGDMTGVGKGRQGAALIRYAVKQGKVPTYFTQKPTLFTDNYRDLADIGSSDLRPFIIASNPKDANIVDADGNIVHKLPSKKEQERVFAYIMEHGTLPDEYDYVLTTYDQIKNGTADYAQNENGTWNTEARKLPKKSKGYTTADYNGQTRRDALAKLAEGNIAILDESHTVGGDSGCGRYMQMLTSSAGGVTFLSATFAKRADNMPIYAQRTAIAEAEVKASELIDAIMKGGVTLQEIMSKQLVESGQMIRRERSFEGVTIDWLSVEEETDRRQRAQFDEVAAIFNAIRNFQDDYITPIIDAKNEAAAEWGATVGHTQGTKDMGVKNVPFASKMYNLVNQLLFALKVDAVADRVVENLRNGYKPVISFTNTMEGFLSSAPKGVAMDEVPNFSLTLMRALDGVMRFTEKDADENTEGGSISLSELSAEGQKAYNAIRDKIMNLTADLPISPMDAIRMKIEEAGYSVAEITGRTMQLNRTEDGKYIVEARKDRDKKAAMRDFNSGKLDVLMINKSGSTGISLHASSKFEDQRQRVMVFAQFQSDINDEVQMRGRIDRSGQVTRGRYEYIMSTIPAEQRIQMMFKAKLKSLDANTTSSQKSKFNEMEIVDYLNKYGDDVVWEYMKEHPELEERLGDPLDMLQEKNSEDGPRTSEKEDTSKKTGCAGKISRYLAFLSVDEQDEIFREITEAYRVKIQLLDDAGENDLEITTMPLRAETKRKQIWHEGLNPGSGNAFADNTYVEEVEVDVLKKPMKRDEIIEATRKLVGEQGIVTEYDQMRYGSKEGEVNWTRYAREKEAEISQFFQAKADEAVGKLREAGEARIAKAREKAVAAATKARGRGENNFTDAEIQSLADTVANEEREKEERKQDKRHSEIMGVKFRIQTLLNRLRAGSIYVVPQDLKQGTPEMFSQTFGTFVGFKFNKTYTLGSSTAIFATLDGRRKVELALSDPAINTIISATEMAYRYSPKEINAITMENWDSNVPTQTRQKRYIITGNLLQALVDTEKGEKTRGNLISYSTIDGETRQGILMGENFKLTDLRNSATLSSRLAQIREGKAVVSENGDVQISKEIYDWRHRGEYELRVPKSKQRGGIYTMHPDLLKLVEGHNFITRGSHMVAYVTQENIAKVVNMLSGAPFNLTVLQESQLSDIEILERQGDGYGAYSDEEVSFENDPASKAFGKNRFSKKKQAGLAARERQRMIDRIKTLAEKLHLDNVEIITDTSVLEGKRAKAKGFFNKRTGKITIVIPNNISTIDAEQTLLHEAVAHYGLRMLFGERFNTFLDNVYQSADENIRRKIAEMAAKNGWDFRTATEEYLAGLAEDINYDNTNIDSWWTRIKRLFLDMLEEIGFDGFRDKVGVVLTDNELRYLLWRSHKNLVMDGQSMSLLDTAEDVAMQSKLKVGNYAEQGIEAEYAAESGDLYRPGDFSPRDQVFARREYERMVSSGSYQFKEAVQDSMLGLKKLYQAILGKGTRIENVSGFENAYLFENRMSSMNAGEQHEYFQRYMQPLLKEIAKIAGADKRKRRELTDYLMAKHGLERNEYMRNEAAANGEETDRDFAGLIGLTGEANWQSAEATAQKWVDDYESMVDTTALWQAINDATKATLEKIYLSGIISKETYEKIEGMYDYYIPLRGWDETTSEQVYGYLTSNNGPLGGNIMKKAKGRASMADDPIATIAMMADDAIRQGNRNLMKQRFLNFVLNHPSDVVSVHDIWLEHDDVADEWRPIFADVEATDTADEIAQKVEAFEQRMEALRNAKPDKYKKGREAQNIPYKVVYDNLREHQILIKRNGRTFVATINGNPRAAQALNGLTNPDVDQNNFLWSALNVATWINRQLSAFYTTRNPDFVVSNFFRDALYSNCMTWIKESPRYALRFHKNFGRVNPIVMRNLLGKWDNGSLDMNNRLEMLFYQFMKNGGETGYTNVRDIESHKKAVAAELKKQGSPGRKAWSALGMQLDLLNRSAENCARFAAFVTSREFGRNIDRAIYDAKEVSVNFNKKGSGGKMANTNGQTKLGKIAAHTSGWTRVLYVFWNAGIQGMTNFGRQAKLHPAKFTAGASALFTLGYVIPLLAQMVGGGDGDDDDKNAYYNLPEYIRRSNICFYAGEQWITIPLPIEYRAMYGMGELAHGVISGNERYTNAELGRQMAAQISQIMPLDMLEGGGGISPFIPSAAKPFTEAYIMNKGWTGLPVYKDTPFNKNEPEWTKAYASADKHLVNFAKWLNETSGGDDFKKGSIDINPAKIEYLLNGTFGGMFTFPNKIKKTGETIFGDRDFEWRNIPIANRLVKSGDERSAYRKLQNEYFKYKNEYDVTGHLMRKYENADNNGVLGYAEKINFLENSPEFLRYEIFDDFKADIDAYREIIAAESDKEKLSKYETEMYATMRELVNALNDPRTYFQKIYEAGNLDDEYIKYLETHHGIRLDNSKQK